MTRQCNSQVLNSIKDFKISTKIESYTKQTLESLFRALLETVMEAQGESVLLVKLTDRQYYQGLLSRLQFSRVKVFDYSAMDCLSDDNLLCVYSDRFSAVMGWSGSNDLLVNGFVTLNPVEASRIAEQLQKAQCDEDLEQALSVIKQDRRHNDKFTKILSKVLSTMDNNQRDLICADSELQGDEDVEQAFSVDQICSTIAHELRNPLGMIGLYSKIIEKSVGRISGGIIDESVLESLNKASETMMNTTQNLEYLLSDLVNYSKPLELKLESVDILELINQTVDLVKPAFDEKKVGLDVAGKQGLLIEVDRFKVHQVLLNLLKNALEATEANGTVVISAEVNNLSLDIKIIDSGCGIPKENLRKVFLPYFTTKTKGSGIGLAQSRKIIEAHKGSLGVESSDINGTTFKLTLSSKLK